MRAAPHRDRAPFSPALLAAVVFVIGAGVGVALCVAEATGEPILGRRWPLLWELAVWALAWAVAVVAAFHLPRRVAVGVVVAAGIAVRLAALAGPPTTSDDLYRYSWDGRVQAAGIDAYAQAPASPGLLRLREPWLWPDSAGCAALHRPTGCTRINRPAARTIYPPVAEAWFAAVGRLGGIRNRHKTWQVAGLVTELGVLALLPVALRRWGRDPRWVALYALCPAPVLEVVNNGHVDGLAVAFVVAALAVMGRPQTGGRDAAAGALIGAAALVKLYPAVLVLAIVGAPGLRPYLAALRAGLTALVVSALAYAPHVVQVGLRVLGYLPGYLREEHYDTAGRFLLAGLAHPPGRLAGPLSVLAVMLVAAWVAVRRPEAPVGASVLLGAVLLAASPVQPWYAVSLLAVATVAGAPRWVAILVAGYPYFFAVILAYRHATALGQEAYGAALAVVVADALLGRRGRSGSSPSGCGTTNSDQRLGGEKSSSWMLSGSRNTRTEP